jgi:hypothetical protein
LKEHSKKDYPHRIEVEFVLGYRDVDLRHHFTPQKSKKNSFTYEENKLYMKILIEELKNRGWRVALREQAVFGREKSVARLLIINLISKYREFRQ